jgi:hypothetical protein
MNSTPPRPTDAPGHRVLGLVSALVLGAVFLFSAGTKILAPRAFLSSLDAYGVLGSSWLLPLGTGVVALELALGAMLVLGLGRRLAARVALPLVLIFVVMIVYALRNGLQDCGCFGEVLKIPPAVELVVDLVLLALTGVVLAWGENLVPAGHWLTRITGWGVFLLGAVFFLSQSPVLPATGRLEVSDDQLALFSQAQPPLDISSGDHFVFLFSADCDHCWAFAGGVELMKERLQGVQVDAVTFSDEASLAGFRRAFAPTYPIHVLPQGLFDQLTDMYPAALWIQGGHVTDGWSGFVPSLRELAESGGYSYRSSTADPGLTSQETKPGIFGGPVRAKRQ